MNPVAFTIIDGGLSTALEECGADISGPLWTARTVIENPDLLERAHRSFVDAGAEIVITASYQCGAGDTDLAATTAIARRAAGARAKVAASIGPFGASLANGSEYTGRYGVSWDVVERYHRDKIAVLVDTEPDLFAVETIPLADEARLVATILLEHGAPPAWFAFGFVDERTTYGGDPLETAVEAVIGYESVIAIGVNCTNPRFVSAITARMHEMAPDLPLVAYPNHGRQWDAVHRCWLGEGSTVPGDSTLAEWLANGVRYVGGCCGVGPDGVRELVAARRRVNGTR